MGRIFNWKFQFKIIIKMVVYVEHKDKWIYRACLYEMFVNEKLNDVGNA